MRVLVTGTSTFFTPRLLQGFGARGVSVTAADDHLWSIGKAVPRTRWVRTPSLSRDPAGYLASLIQELKTRHYDLLLPTFEESLLLAEFREEIESLTCLLLPPFEVMWQLHHKPSLYNLCCDLDIPAPPTVTRPNPFDLEEQVSGLKFPVVLKLPTSNNSVGREYCDTLPELVERFQAVYTREIEQQADTPFVQQKIDGEAIYTLMLCHEGRKLGEVIYRPLRTFPENGGTSSHRESIHHPQIEVLTERLAAATGWSGFLGLDFIVDRTDGTPYLIDANPRANPAVHLGYLGGVDWTGLLLDLQHGRNPEPVIARPGVRNSTPLLDALWLLEALPPRRNWAQNLYQRARKVFKPDWKLDSGHDFMGKNEWLCHMAIGWQGFSAIGKSLMSGDAIAKCFLNGANYDPLTVQKLRQSMEVRHDVLSMPSRSVTKEIAAAG
jgi:predicted ATP-grasp superfamily ATP-dependent carboligase